MAKETLYLYNINQYVGYAIIDADTRYFDFVLCGDKTNFYVNKMVTDLWLEDEKADRFFTLVEERTYDEDRIDLLQICASNGLLYYDRWELFKRQHGLYINDTYWVSETKVDGEVYWGLVSDAYADYIRQLMTE